MNSSFLRLTLRNKIVFVQVIDKTSGELLGLSEDLVMINC